MIIDTYIFGQLYYTYSLGVAMDPYKGLGGKL